MRKAGCAGEMKNASHDTTVKALQAMRAGYVENGIRYAIIGNAVELLENQREALASKDAAIAEQARQLREALAALEKVKRERDAARHDAKGCHTCAKFRQCDPLSGHAECLGYKWRGPCAENGGTEDGI